MEDSDKDSLARRGQRLFEQLDSTLWGPVSWVGQTGSTNADLAEQARLGAPEGTVLISDYQNIGRGRFTRPWVAPAKSSIAMSVLVRPKNVELNRWTWLPLLVGLAVAQGLCQATGLAAELKWPNDVLVNGRKVCGILCERVETPFGPGAVLGMGINTKMTPDELPVPTATSLAIEGAEVSQTQVAAAVLRSLEAKYSSWLAGEDLAREYLGSCRSIGREVVVVLSETERVQGFAEGVDAGGALLVRVGDQVRAYSAGDVIHLR
ncbi:MAG: biotin--[acetyl-CoA-carboxylase] ligase [Propionibacteriaceae bacterium]|jgi:BirA family biotin operon repressor/biotin-[acetyl-CoA-carboxylase] ligase|nr:biotin--[acetyl-CoA-carboxylase] ligase [Propionibacteriaceae bacterium]